MKKNYFILLATTLIFYGTVWSQYISTSPGQTNGDIYHLGGNVGIGTVSPDSKLTVAGGAGEQNQGQIHIIGNSGNGFGDAYISFYEGAEANSKWSLGVKDNNNVFAISHGLTMDAEPRLVIQDVTGNVGIGTISPDSKLTVAGGAGEQNQGQIHIIGNSGNGFGDAYISFYEGAEANSKWSLGVKDNNNVFAISHGLTMDAEPRLVIQDVTGNVGIGTTTPDAKLTVAGNVHSQEVRVTVNAGADFVFEEDYDLKPLNEVENYIKTNKHLPEIPSEKQMLQDGVHLGEMNIKLLQKIEELTLYTIQQDKTLKQQQKLIEKLTKRMEILEHK